MIPIESLCLFFPSSLLTPSKVIMLLIVIISILNVAPLERGSRQGAGHRVLRGSSGGEVCRGGVHFLGNCDKGKVMSGV